MTSPWRPRTLILQHEEPTPPGHMTEWLAEQGARIEVFRIDEKEEEVNPRDYDLIVSLGSEFAAFDDSIPFVQREVTLYEQAIEADVPILGLCFGGQMLARVLGSRLFRAEKAEIG
jgi:GMP synthase-like glutamine amidotransferase